ncbi:MAG: hypothetical protein GQ558_06270, partial [Thermoplasmata archaeon]|nr:hypothetical protein [Thermoplasmata archaeon]
LDWNKYVEIDPRYYRPAEVDLLLGDSTKAHKKLGWVHRAAGSVGASSTALE